MELIFSKSPNVFYIPGIGFNIQKLCCEHIAVWNYVDRSKNKFTEFFIFFRSNSIRSPEK